MASRAKRSAIELYPYQARWVTDVGRFKIGLWCRQSGKSFATSLEAVIDCQKRKTDWVFLSAGERQSKELIRKARMHCEAYDHLMSESDTLIKTKDGTVYKQLEILFQNGSRILALPANPDTARGHSANVVLDEFAFHQDSRKIWQALFPTITRGYKIRIISTPQGKKNKFYDLWSGSNSYSKHFTDIHGAVQEGLKIYGDDGDSAGVEYLREALDDEDAWNQEYECIFVDETTAYIPYELISEAERPELDEDCNETTGGPIYCGIDVGRSKHFTVFWAFELIGDVLWHRKKIEMANVSFTEQFNTIVSEFRELNARRLAIDCTGLGAQLAEQLTEVLGPSAVEAVGFRIATKEELAVRTKRYFEDHLIRIPVSRKIREDIHNVKKIVTSHGNVRFNAEATKDGHCYDSETEILTLDGWKSFADLLKTDRVASLDSGKSLTFVSPTEIQSFEHNGEMVRVQNKQIDLLVTPNHKMYVNFTHLRRGFEFVDAASLVGYKVRVEYKKDADWTAPEPELISVCGEDVDAKMFMRFMGLFISEGFSSTDNRIGITQSHIAKDEYIMDCLLAMPWPFHVEPNLNGAADSARTKRVALWEYLSPLGKCHEKYIPRDLLQYGPGLLGELFDALMYGDGAKRMSNGAQWTYYTTSERLAGDVQELLLKIGLAGNINARTTFSNGSKNKRTLYEVNINRTRLTPITNKRKMDHSFEQYEGHVYCCTVPSGVVYVRRNGKACWSGNSDRFWSMALAIHASHNPSVGANVIVGLPHQAFINHKIYSDIMPMGYY